MGCLERLPDVFVMDVEHEAGVHSYFALLRNYFVYLVMFHSGLSMFFDLKSVLSMAGRILTN